MDRQPSPFLLPILRSRQQGEILTLLLGDPDLELSLTQISDRTGVPYPSVHREVERAESAGIATSRRIGQTRLVRANTNSPYYSGLAEVLVRAFGPPDVLGTALGPIQGISRAFIYGSWAARFAGHDGDRPVGDLDLLILGNPEREEVFTVLSAVEERLGRPVHVTFRPAGWLTTGTGPFHGTIVERPMVEVDLLNSQTLRSPGTG